MWCNVCQCEVVSEVTADNGRAVCATCGQVLTSVVSTAPGPSVEARELLDRWASSHLFDPYGPPRKNIEPAAGPATNPTSHEFTADAPQTTSDSQSPPIVPPQTQPAQFDAVPPAGHMPQGVATNPGGEPSAIAPPPVVYPSAPRVENSLPEVVPQPPSPIVSTQGRDTAQPTIATQTAEQSTTECNLHSSAAELDRLTNEILSRVSQISEDRRQRIELAAAELPIETTSNVKQEGDVGGIDLTRRVDTEHPCPSPFTSVESHEREEAVVSETVPQTGRVATTAHDSVDSGGETETAATDEADRQVIESNTSSGSGMPGIGQILSYIGILGLTAGTSFVIVGYFGGPASYAPTGWLVATIGQMLLFLGIVTLVSNGIEQTSDELQKTVNDRIDGLSGRLESIGDKLIRIEFAESNGPRRPHMLDRSENRRPMQSTTDSRQNR